MQEVVQRVMDRRARQGLARSVLTLIVLDVVWIYTVMGPKYAVMGRAVQGGRDVTLRLLPAVASYALMVVGLQVFVLSRPRRDRGAHGALFGAIVYGLYNGTCMSIFADWSPTVAALDIAWGAAVFAIAARVS